jgi:hypothetical protein
MGGFLLGLGITAAYWPGISGAASTPRWIIAALLSVVLFCRIEHQVRLTAAHVLGLAFVVWSLATLFWSEHPDDTIGAGVLLLMMVAAFCVGGFADMKAVYLGCAAGLLISDVVAVAQMAGWDGPLAANVPAGLFVNKNYFAEMSALVAVALIAERLWWALPAALPGLVLTNARGALLGLLAAGFLMVWRYSRWHAVGLAALALIVIGGISLTGVKAMSASDRLDIWGSAAVLLNWHGYGFGSFRESAPHIDWIPYKTGHAYNEFIEAAFETGFVGCALLVAFLASLFRRPLATEHFVLIALIVEACFDFPFHIPSTAILGALVAGRIAADLPGVRRPAWLGRVALWRGVPHGEDRLAGGFGANDGPSQGGGRAVSV